MILQKRCKGYVMKISSRINSILLVAAIAWAVCFTSAFPVSAASPSKYTWKEKTAPNYVVKVGKAKVSGKPKKGTIRYSKLDKYGRTRRVVGNITYKMVREAKGGRDDFANDAFPTGWGNNKKVKIKLYNGKKYEGYIWNRSHLIADSLGGKAIRINLITGTRMQNVGANDGIGGMAYTERKVVKYLEEHHDVSVYYSADPVYKGKELVPRSVVVDIRSSDKKLNERVIVYNAAKGFELNYKKGSKAKGAGALAITSSSSTVYITKTGKKYHLKKSCDGLENAHAIYKTTKSKAKSRGLTLCKICAYD